MDVKLRKMEEDGSPGYPQEEDGSPGHPQTTDSYIVGAFPLRVPWSFAGALVACGYPGRPCGYLGRLRASVWFPILVSIASCGYQPYSTGDVTRLLFPLLPVLHWPFLLAT